LRKSALDTDPPDGDTMLRFGVKLETPGMPMAGQNERAFPVIIQYIDDKPNLVWPTRLQLREPPLPLPASSGFAAR
jgi:branched-chain amino acid transport system substrate-binding protein